MKRYLLSIFLLTCFVIPVAAQAPPIGIIDFFGLKTVTKQQVLEKLQIKAGDAVPSPAILNETITRLKNIPNVEEVTLDLPCCDEKYGKTILYIGIREKGAPFLKFRKAPTGNVRLPHSVLKLEKEFYDALSAAVMKGDSADDGSKGHSLLANKEARAVQEKFIEIVAKEGPMLRKVLRGSSDADHRAFAVQIIAYSADKRKVADDLVYAMSDPSETVRNNATRALAVLAGYALKNPGLKIKIPYRPFIDLLNSVSWTDRNKASLALFSLTESRDPELPALLKRNAGPSLFEMARWQSNGHAFAPFVILGRIYGFEDGQLFEAMQNGGKDRYIGIFEHIRNHE